MIAERFLMSNNKDSIICIINNVTCILTAIRLWKQKAMVMKAGVKRKRLFAISSSSSCPPKLQHYKCDKLENLKVLTHDDYKEQLNKLTSIKFRQKKAILPFNLQNFSREETIFPKPNEEMYTSLKNISLLRAERQYCRDSSTHF